jgi:hypothetical protein
LRCYPEILEILYPSSSPKSIGAPAPSLASGAVKDEEKVEKERKIGISLLDLHCVDIARYWG